MMRNGLLGKAPWARTAGAAKTPAESAKAARRVKCGIK
jgi:hypothetical protein